MSYSYDNPAQYASYLTECVREGQIKASQAKTAIRRLTFNSKLIEEADKTFLHAEMIYKGEERYG